MAGNVQLANFLNNEEIAALSDNIKTKIETHFCTVHKEFDELKAKHETLRVNSEQQYFEIERQLIESNKKLEDESADKTHLKSKLEETEKRYNEASTRLKSVEEIQESNLSTQLRLTRLNEQLENEKREFAVLLEKKNREIDNLNDELKQLSKKLGDVNTAKYEALVKLDEVSSNEVNKQYQIKRLEQEKDNLQKQVEWLNTDLAKRTQELMVARREKSTSVLELDSQLKDKIEECSLLQSTVESIKDTNKEQQAKIEKLLQRIKDIQESNSKSEEQFRQEIQARVKLAEIYKVSAEDEETKSAQLTGAVTELQKLLKEASNEYSELENKKEEECASLQKVIDEKSQKVETLQDELKKANELLSAMKTRGVSDEQLETMFPTAAATSKMLKSGMTLTEIYSEYVRVSEGMQLEQAENKRLNTYLDQILQEVERKAPLLKKQREDYEIALNSIEQMTRQLDSAMVESQRLQTEADESHRKASHLTKENLKQCQQIRDLSVQVKFLVKEIEELRGGRVVRDEEVSSSDASNSSQVISDRLVTFRNLEELQSQNQKLLSVVRELSEKQEDEENAEIDSRTKELKEQLEQAHEELQELRDAQSRAEDLMASIIQQRDCYKVLLREREQNISKEEKSGLFGEGSSSKSPNVSSALKSPGADKRSEEMSKALLQQQEIFNSYKKEKLENEKILQEQLDNMRQESSSLRTTNAKISSQLEYAAERYKVLQGNAEGYKKEIALLREKVIKYSASVAKHEQTVKTLRQDLMSTQEKLAMAESRVNSIKSEKDLVVMSEHRLSTELESLRRERETQTMLMANLQAIQNNLERNEYETKHRLGKQVETLERDKTYLKNRVTAEEKQHQAAVKHWQNQVQETKQQIEMEIKGHQQTKDLLNTTHKQLQDMKQQLVLVTNKLNSAEARLADKADGSAEEGSSVQVQELKAQLEEAWAERDSLQTQLVQAKQHAEQYKTHADTFQQELKELTKVNAESTEELEEKLREATSTVEHLKARLDNLETERQELLNENIRITEENHKLSADLRKQLASLQNEMQEAVQQRETAISQESVARQQCEQQQQVASEAQDKYERELMLHAADVEALTALKQKMEGFNEKLAQTEEQARLAELQLNEYKVSAEKKQDILVKENEKLSARLNDLLNETRALHEQMRKLSNQVIAVQEHERSATVSKTTPLTSSADQEASKSAEQLLEVVRYLRKEKDIAEGKLDVAETECSRLKQRCDSLERQLDMVNSQLNEERQQTQANMQTAAQHAELMLKVESNNLLHDSNKLLREENTQLQAQLAQTEAKLSKLEETIRPLQEEIRSVQAQREALMVERKTALTELERWKARTNQLIENAHKTDPEEHKKLIAEKEELRKQVNSLTDELHKTRAESTKLNIEYAKLQRQNSQTKEEVTKLTESNESLTKAKTDLEADAAEKVKTITQLKKIGRKYKEQAESVTKEFEDFKSKQEGEAAQKQSAQQVTTVQIETLEKKLKEVEARNENLISTQKELESKRDELEKTVSETQTSKSQLENKLKEIESKRAELEGQVIALRSAKEKKEQTVDTETSRLKDEVTQLQQELTGLKDENSQIKEEKTELDKKLTRANTTLQMAKTKLQSMKEMNEKLITERQELKKKLSSLESEGGDSGRAQLEEQVKNLEQAMATKDSNYQKEVADLQNKIQQLQKQLETSQKLVPPQSQVQVSRAPGSGAQDRASSSPSEPPKTANIRPIASSPAAIKPQTVPVQPQSAASKVTASIRPMAIAPTSSTQTSTPTATVMPTTVSQLETVDEEPMAPVQQLFSQQPAPGTSRPTQQVQRVHPTQESVSQESVELPPPVEIGVSEPQASTSRDMPMVAVATKRQRDETESPGDESMAKKSKHPFQETEHKDIPEITVTDESQTTTVPASEVESQGDVVPESLDYTSADEDQSQSDEDIFADKGEESQDGEINQGSSGEEVEEVEELEEEEEQDDDDDDAVIIVASDDEEQEGDEEEDEEEEEEDDEEVDDDEEEFPHEGMETYPDQEEQIEEELEGEMEEVGYHGQEEMQAADQAQSNNDVVIIDEDEESNTMESQETEPQTSQVSSQLLPPLLPLPPERQLSGGRQNQLTPFMIGGNPSGFEDLDDCTVPSTPTLNVPRRGDGFAEAVSSPQVAQSFIFGSGADQQMGLSGLAQLESQQGLGMGMDETRMDLSHLDESTGRSVPSTPLHTTAPVTIISDVVEGLEADPEDTSEFTHSEQDHETAGDEEGEQEETGNEQDELVLEGEGEALEGEQGEEDEDTGDTEKQSDSQSAERTEGSRDAGEATSSQGDVAGSSSSDRSQEANKPKIQKIVWSSPPAMPPSTTQPVGQPIQSLLGTPSFRPSRGGVIPRGPSPQRAGPRGGYPRGQLRRPMRGASRGNVYRRPPMY